MKTNIHEERRICNKNHKGAQIKHNANDHWHIDISNEQSELLTKITNIFLEILHGNYFIHQVLQI